MTNNFAFRNYTEFFNSPTEKGRLVYGLWVTPKLLTIPPRPILHLKKTLHRDDLSRRLFQATSRSCRASYLTIKPVHNNWNKPLPIVRNFQETWANSIALHSQFLSQAYKLWSLADKWIHNLRNHSSNPIPSPVSTYIFQNEEREQEEAERDMGSNRPFRMRFASSSSLRIKLVQGCNVLDSSVHVLKPAVFMAPLRLPLNHTPTALLTTIVGRGVVLASLRGREEKSRQRRVYGWRRGVVEVRIRGLQKFPLTNGRKPNIA